MSTSLDTDVRAALEQRKGDWQTVAKESGVSYSWISKFMNGHIDNPGFTTLKELHAYLMVHVAEAAPSIPSADRRHPADLPLSLAMSGHEVAAPPPDGKTAPEPATAAQE